MSKFLTGNELINVIDDIVWEAEKTLLVVSPYIKLDKEFKKFFDKHLNSHELHILLIFGKNEKAISRSMSKLDLDYFKQFPNISIIHAPQLHGKYYGNEKKGVITSINLYDFSFKNNIEFGIYNEHNPLSTSADSSNNSIESAWHKCIEIANQSEVIFIKRPMYEEKDVLNVLTKFFVKSEELLDNTKQYYSFSRNNEKDERKLKDFPDYNILNNSNQIRPEREFLDINTSDSKDSSKRKIGYCIRTGKEIAFNPQKPLSWDAWNTWSILRNFDYAENYCHKTGEKSYGKTSMAKPILNE